MILHPMTIASALIAVMLLYLSSHRSHLLMLLLFFEGMVLILSAAAALTIKHSMIFSFMIILTLGATEASLGLCLLVMMARSFGTDMIKTLSINKT